MNALLRCKATSFWLDLHILQTSCREDSALSKGYMYGHRAKKGYRFQSADQAVELALIAIRSGLRVLGVCSTPPVLISQMRWKKTNLLSIPTAPSV